MERYSEYKDSGVKWLGQIPSHWEISKLKWILNNNNIKVGPFGSSLTGKVEIDHPVKIYGQWNIVAGNFEAGDNFVSEETFNNLKTYEVFPGDFLVSMMGTVGKCLLAPSNIARGIMDSHILKIRLDNTKIDNRFFKYVYDKDNSSIVFQNIQVMKKGSIMDGLNSIIIKSLLIPLPSLSEQESIADFLDSATTQIDAAIAQQQKMIDLLNERKQIIINNAVTKGLDPNVKMKPSGIDWIGDIPEHWRLMQYRHLFYNLDKLRMPIAADQRSRNNPRFDYYGASGVIDKIDYYNVDDKVLLIGEDGANLLLRNLPLIYKAEGKIWVNNHAHILKPIRDDYDYMAYVMEAADYTLFITGSAQPKLSQANLNSVKLPIPPLKEQIEIVRYLGKRTEKIDISINKSKRMISLLQERKQIIINDVVTGKVKVV